MRPSDNRKGAGNVPALIFLMIVHRDSRDAAVISVITIIGSSVITVCFMFANPVVSIGIVCGMDLLGLAEVSTWESPRKWQGLRPAIIPFKPSPPIILELPEPE